MKKWIGLLLVSVTMFSIVNAQNPDLSGKIVIWGWTAAIRDTMEAAGIVENFRAEYPNVEVEIVYYAPSDVYTNLPLALTAGSGACDVCLVEDSHLSEFVYLGGLTDLTESVEPYLDKTNAYRWPNAEYEGRYYAMPWDSGPVVMYYRHDVFEAAGLDTDPEAVSEMVATWEGYLNTCRTIKEETGLYCFAMNKANNYGRLYEMMLWERGLGYYDRETGAVIVDSPENVEMLEMLGKFWEEDLVSDNLEWTDPWYAEFSEILAEGGKPVATLIEASWMDVFFKSWIAPGTEGLWGVAYMPGWDATTARAANDGGSAFVIPEQSQNKEAAWAFIEFALGREESQLAMFDISGFIPALETTYGDPLFQEPDPFFADQVTRAVYADVVEKIPDATIYGPHYSMMNGAVSLAIQLYATGQASAQDALTQVAEEIRASLE
jgi:lactose/L-arabinose transport system substrate-binding protein